MKKDRHITFYGIPISRDLNNIYIILCNPCTGECGYDVPLEKIERITAFHTSVGFAGSKQTLYYTEVNESMKVSEGGGIDHEDIEVIYLPISEAKALIYDENIAKTPGLMFAFTWWFDSVGN